VLVACVCGSSESERNRDDKDGDNRRIGSKVFTKAL